MVKLYFTENVRLARSPQSPAILLDTTKNHKDAYSNDQTAINISPPNGHARQQINAVENHTKKQIRLHSTDEVAQHVISNHSRRQHAIDSFSEDDDYIEVARILHSFGDDDDYYNEYEIDIDIEKIEYKST